jgi:hypothetical protein
MHRPTTQLKKCTDETQWIGQVLQFCLISPSDTHTRLTQEAIFIKTIENTLNRDIGSLVYRV